MKSEHDFIFVEQISDDLFTYKCLTCNKIIYLKHGDENVKECITGILPNRRIISFKNREIGNAIRGRISKALSGKYKYKTSIENVEKIIGCSIIEYRNHLESLFKSGMSWNNYGKWQIDHIIPQCAFDLSSDYEMKKCFHYLNTQPLWASENARKGNKY
jgi:hypothetical protein